MVSYYSSFKQVIGHKACYNLKEEDSYSDDDNWNIYQKIKIEK
jgi:hypothetical protein